MSSADVSAARTSNEVCAQNINSGSAVRAGKGVCGNRFPEDPFQTCSKFRRGQERGKAGAQSSRGGVGRSNGRKPDRMVLRN